MAITIIAKNQTAGDLALNNLSAPDAKIPASGQVTLTDYNYLYQIQADPQLYQYIVDDDVLLNDGTNDLSKAQSLLFASAVAMTSEPNFQYDSIYFVAKNGDDANDGLSPERPKLTIQAAITAASAGDAIRIGPGDYGERVNVTKNIALIGETSPWLEGNSPVVEINPTMSTDGYAALYGNAANIYLENLLINPTWTGATGTGYGFYWSSTGDRIVAKNCAFQITCSTGTGSAVNAYGMYVDALSGMDTWFRDVDFMVWDPFDLISTGTIRALYITGGTSDQHTWVNCRSIDVPASYKYGNSEFDTVSMFMTGCTFLGDSYAPSSFLHNQGLNWFENMSGGEGFNSEYNIPAGTSYWLNESRGVLFRNGEQAASKIYLGGLTADPNGTMQDGWLWHRDDLDEVRFRLNSSTYRWGQPFSANIITVDPNSDLADYATIQGAIDAAGNGDTILVAPGIYAEKLSIDGTGSGVKDISIIGMGGFEGPAGTNDDAKVMIAPTLTTTGEIAVDVLGSIVFYMANISISPTIAGSGTYTGLRVNSAAGGDKIFNNCYFGATASAGSSGATVRAVFIDASSPYTRFWNCIFRVADGVSLLGTAYEYDQDSGSVWMYGCHLHADGGASNGDLRITGGTIDIFGGHWDGSIINTGGTVNHRGDAIHRSAAGEVNGLTDKATPVGADLLVIEDSAASYAKKKVQITNLLAGAETNRVQAYYVGKHGNDGNSGLTPNKAKLTFGSAITAAAAQSPSTSNRFVIVCEDAGIYSASITCQAWIDIQAPDAILSGSIALADNSNVVFKRITGSSGTLITKTSGTGISRVKVDDLEATSTAGCLLNSGTSAVVILEAKTVQVATGTAIGDVSTAAGHVHLNIEDLYISGNSGTGIARFGSGSIVGRITHILETGTPTGTTAINVAGGEMDLVVGTIATDNSYIVASGATLRLVAGNISGATSVSGTARVISPSQVAGAFNFSGVLSPASIGANQNNYSPTGLANANFLRLTSSAAYQITGLAGGAGGRVILVHNVGSFPLTLVHESASSTTTNRFYCRSGKNVVLVPNMVIALQYDSTTGRWRILGGDRPTLSKSFWIENPTATESIGIWTTDLAITITKVMTWVAGTTPSVTWNMPHGTNPTSGANLFTSGQTTTTTGSVTTHSTGFNDNTLAAGEALRLTTSAKSGTVNGIHLTIFYTED